VSTLRRTTVSAAAVAAILALALAGCAPPGANGYGDPASNNKAVNQPAAEPAQKPAPKKPAVKLTTELNAKTLPRMGTVVTDQNGWLLYRFDKDKPAKTNCVGVCARVWPPALTDGNTVLNGVDENLVGIVTRPDGTRQITLAGWPLYRYVGDKKPGQWKGQKVANTWFVAAPTGRKNLTCLPPGTPKAVPPPPAAPEDNGGDDNGGGEEVPPPTDGY
jgi:predicted lipoprotein with Yx(FWY)xxD motif